MPEEASSTQSTDQTAGADSSAASVGITDSTASSAETENTAAEGTETTAGEERIPMSRFRQVVAQKNEAVQRYEALESKINALEERLKPQPTEENEDPQMAQVRDLVTKFSEEHFKAKTGLTYDDAKALFHATRTTGEDAARRRWTELCQQSGMDPQNEQIQQLALGLVKTGHSAEKAVEILAPFVKAQASQNGTSRSAANVETAADITGVMTTTEKVPRTAHEAVEMAARGELAPSETLDQIFARRSAGRK